jgi:dipeptidyl aminopeptidase/acylaminoacyl peptidase
MKASSVISLAAALCCSAAIAKEPPPLPVVNDDAALFGALETAYSAALSADGTKMVFVGPGTGKSTIAVVVDLVAADAKQIARADGDPMGLRYCDWSAADRLVCSLQGLTRINTYLLGIVRTLAMNSDGSKQLRLGEKDTIDQIYRHQVDGYVIDWMNGIDGTVLMSRSYVPEKSTGKITARVEEGLGVARVDTRTGKASMLEKPGDDVVEYISDGRGAIRLMTTTYVAESGYLRGDDTHFYRMPNDRQWRKLGSYKFDGKGTRGGTGMIPVAVDSNINAAYVLQPLDGRYALYRVLLDGSMKSELVFASKEVDVDNVVRVGRGGRVVGATYTTDRTHVEYFDPDYQRLHATLAKALPKLPLIDFVGASGDEQILLVHGSSDVDPGHWYVYDRTRKALVEAITSRPGLKGKQLSPVKSISYAAADGKQIPSYLTLPPGVTDAKNLPAIVMPHGGPAARDEWGFDWLAQYFAQKGYAVLQPNYRGSAGYGDQWFNENGFRGWKTSIGDVCDAGRWLISQGIADPSKLAVFGWSYGGYAALQVNVMDPDLFKAVVAVAPVSDLALLKSQGMIFASAFQNADYIGSGPHIKEGSPAQNAQAFKSPVLMFHGTKDLNVDIDQAKRMDRELRGAGKSTELVIYPELEHSLVDGTARADMLRRSEAFLRKNLKL